MTKSQFIKKLRRRLTESLDGVNEKIAQKAVNQMIADVSNRIKRGERVEISDFGSFPEIKN